MARHLGAGERGDINSVKRELSYMRVAVVSESGSPLMPTKPSRARRWIKEGKAVGKWSKLGVFYVQLTVPASDVQTQPIAVGLDPGKLYSGIGVQSAKCTLLLLHIVLPFKTVRERMEQRSMLRRSRRGRRIDRKLSFKKRSHRQKRFKNRSRSGAPPSIGANKYLEILVVSQILRLYPVSHLTVEQVKARGDKSFSPVMVGQQEQFKHFTIVGALVGYEVSAREGWETSALRKKMGLPKNKQDKSRQSPETHAVDGVTLACTNFVKYGITSTNSMGWRGKVEITPAQFVVVKRPPFSRRQLHLQQYAKGGIRRKYGGSTTRHGFRKGDYVEAVKSGKTYRGWVSGDTEKQVSVSDFDWKRLGQFTASKVRLVQRNTRLLVSSTRKLSNLLASNQ